MIKFIFTLLLALLPFTMQAQSFTKSGNTYSQVQNSRSSGNVEKTQFHYSTPKSGALPVYINKNSGRCFIIKTSQKSGKEYKTYLPEDICRDICKQLGITYKENKGKNGNTNS